MPDPDASPERLRALITLALTAVSSLAAWARARVNANSAAVEWLRDELADVKFRLAEAEDEIAYDKAITSEQQKLIVTMRDKIQTVMEDHNTLAKAVGEPEKYTPADWNYHGKFAGIEEAGRAAMMHARHVREERERERRARGKKRQDDAAE